MLDTNWQKLYEAAILEINPDKVVTLIEAAERAIVEHESRPDVTQLERRKLADARSMQQNYFARETGCICGVPAQTTTIRLRNSQPCTCPSPRKISRMRACRLSYSDHWSAVMPTKIAVRAFVC